MTLPGICWCGKPRPDGLEGLVLALALVDAGWTRLTGPGVAADLADATVMTMTVRAGPGPMCLHSPGGCSRPTEPPQDHSEKRHREQRPAKEAQAKQQRAACRDEQADGDKGTARESRPGDTPIQCKILMLQMVMKPPSRDQPEPAGCHCCTQRKGGAHMLAALQRISNPGRPQQGPETCGQGAGQKYRNGDQAKHDGVWHARSSQSTTNSLASSRYFTVNAARCFQSGKLSKKERE